MMLMVATAQALTPVPPAPPVDWNYEVQCKVFDVAGTAHWIAGRLDRRGMHDVEATIVDRSGRFEFGRPGARAFISGPNRIVMNSPRGKAAHTYHFEMPASTANGTLTITGRQGNGSMRFVATGVCDVIRKKAKSS